MNSRNHLPASSKTGVFLNFEPAQKLATGSKDLPKGNPVQRVPCSQCKMCTCGRT